MTGSRPVLPPQPERCQATRDLRQVADGDRTVLVTPGHMAAVRPELAEGGVTRVRIRGEGRHGGRVSRLDEEETWGMVRVAVGPREPAFRARGQAGWAGDEIGQKLAGR